jgi:hypothetical protein
MSQVEPWQWVFVDETWFNTQMSRYWGWAEKGDRIPEAIPAGHWRSFTLLGAMTGSGLLIKREITAAGAKANAESIALYFNP